MSDASGTDTAVTTDTEPKGAKTPPPARSRAPRPAAAPRTTSGKKVKCAGCGKEVELDTETSVGGREPIRHHSCSQMAAKLHAWWIETLSNPDAPAPAVTK